MQTQDFQKYIYLDNAATTFPKAPGVKEAVNVFLKNIGAIPGRSGHALSIQSGRILFQTRRLLADLLGLKDCKRVLFTLNATMAINTLLQGFLKPNDIVVTTQMEHNAIKRPLNALKETLNIEVREIPCNSEHVVDLKSAKELLKGAKLLACTHINNVSGAITPIEELAKIAHANGGKILLDGAQSVGCVPMQEIMQQVDFLALSAHKGLLSPMGVGALLMSDSFDFNTLSPLVFGGTGSASEEEIQPYFLPDKFEGGTPNMHGISGLKVGLEWIIQKGVENIHAYELHLRNMLIQGLNNAKNIKIYHTKGDSSGILSLTILNCALSEAGMRLSNEYGIYVRVGLHCSPSSHKTLGSFTSGGTIRLSPGIFNTESEIETTIWALRHIAKN
ncbi:aminotransferase class V-fold PLP-dependent enzyme [Helicobacter turcicus]|uniref:Aminotransferase class V-fold PLP-dependent enzyme n=1 Tax=Helicobacter turcicus TaxID=2867412 RepID=A0ABS7JPN6_9HELI|nr:aminotransferase class V-fold PLP-dependent enzyme [Helicobacter turcicus]MBX7491371.1 aminotransferase class V-fold PLP-dependent enzyme [Helicobacter turcicus]MBX7546238.1 aminotransferase class V-fold PLP-dependent enzyme [Helicobacter turcicus]